MNFETTSPAYFQQRAMINHVNDGKARQHSMSDEDKLIWAKRAVELFRESRGLMTPERNFLGESRGLSKYVTKFGKPEWVKWTLGLYAPWSFSDLRKELDLLYEAKIINQDEHDSLSNVLLDAVIAGTGAPQFVLPDRLGYFVRPLHSFARVELLEFQTSVDNAFAKQLVGGPPVDSESYDRYREEFGVTPVTVHAHRQLRKESGSRAKSTKKAPFGEEELSEELAEGWRNVRREDEAGGFNGKRCDYCAKHPRARDERVCEVTVYMNGAMRCSKCVRSSQACRWNGFPKGKRERDQARRSGKTRAASTEKEVHSRNAESSRRPAAVAMLLPTESAAPPVPVQQGATVSTAVSEDQKAAQGSSEKPQRRHGPFRELPSAEEGMGAKSQTGGVLEPSRIATSARERHTQVAGTSSCTLMDVEENDSSEIAERFPNRSAGRERWHTSKTSLLPPGPTPSNVKLVTDALRTGHTRVARGTEVPEAADIEDMARVVEFGIPEDADLPQADLERVRMYRNRRLQALAEMRVFADMYNKVCEDDARVRLSREDSG
ncbi:hypothetical protein BV25DRAFT_1922318 [Artomyces pyxidatus]|uniref:Uncharacterized protein n=1 Tax=Artomyces pyxidatus TaxID=48021 RepID=A0ACB8SF27_9AGAM|nr:hypothetical protein BV25DRAFT_1922318 [Artomyces pyxidatus]